MPESLLPLLRVEVPILPFAPLGIDALRQVFTLQPREVSGRREQAPRQQGEYPLLLPLIDEIEKSGRGVILTMGKGGVGKTTVAAAVAVELAHRGHRVHLSTTDPAAHIADAIGSGVAGMSVSRIDPALETRWYSEQVLADAGRGLDAQGRAVLEEDLRSPCTEEVAVFHAFSRLVFGARREIVVMDTAPTGHTLLLLDATGAYHREMLRNAADAGSRSRLRSCACATQLTPTC
jgi:arsenite-transporting ATPase